MNKQRKVLITITYNEMGIIIDTKAEEVVQPNLQPTCNQLATDTISRQAAIDAIVNTPSEVQNKNNPLVNQYDGATFRQIEILGILEALPSAQPEDYTELKREFLRMASYIDVLLECSDEQKTTLLGFISRLAEFMPWTERD